MINLLGYESKYIMDAWNRMSEFFPLSWLAQGWQLVFMSMAATRPEMWIGRFDANTDSRNDWQQLRKRLVMLAMEIPDNKTRNETSKMKTFFQKYAHSVTGLASMGSPAPCEREGAEGCRICG